MIAAPGILPHLNGASVADEASAADCENHRGTSQTMPGTAAAALSVHEATQGPTNQGLAGWLRLLLRGILIGLCLALVLEAGRVLLGRNLHTVLPGRVYRCAQPSGEDVERLGQTLGIRTVVNLRGSCDPSPFYLEES